MPMISVSHPEPAVQPALCTRLAAVRERIAAAAARAGRSRYDVTLVVVGKSFDVALIRAARGEGQVDFGESRAQELRAKARELGGGFRWHFVGRLQRNKAPDVVGLAALIHSVDRLELAEAIADHARRAGLVQRVLVQVNAGRDPAKGGCDPEATTGLVAKVRMLDGIACEGLMTVPPLDADPRSVFATLRGLRDDLRCRFPEVEHLSMGMSADLELAVEEGATIVRVGEAVFGPRPAPPERPTRPAPPERPTRPAPPERPTRPAPPERIARPAPQQDLNEEEHER
jgi:PLP dependent protein